MKLKERILIALSSFVLSTVLFWFFGGIYFYIIFILGIVYIFIGGRHNA